MAETRLEVIYSVTSTTYTTQLFNVTGNFVKAELGDGTQLPDSIFAQENKAYLFDETGLTSVFYTLCGNTLVNDEFAGMTRIVGVNVPSTVTSIPERCFRNCSILSDAYITSSVTNIASGAFENTAIEFFEIPATSVTIGDRVFAGCSALTAITMNAPTAPSVSQNTFYQVHTGGTLTYPSGSDYSSWLSNNEYYLGYYGWTGVTPTPPPTPDPQGAAPIYFTLNGTGSIDTAITSGAQSVCFTTKVLNLSGNVSSITFSAVSLYSSEVLIYDGTAVTPSQEIAPAPIFNYTLPLNAGDTGNTCINFQENNTEYLKIFLYYVDCDGEIWYNNSSEPTEVHVRLAIKADQSGGTITPSASISFASNSVTTSASNTRLHTGIIVCGCTVDTQRGFDIVSVTGDFPVSANGYFILSETSINPEFTFPYNSGSTQRSSTVVCRFYDTSGNSYTDDILLTQQRPTSPYATFYPRKSTISSSAQSVCTELAIYDVAQPYQIYLSYSAMTGFTEFPTPVLNNNMVCMDIPENQTGAKRNLTLSYTVSSSTNTYIASFDLDQDSGSPTPSASISFTDSAKTVNYSSVSPGTSLTICGCTLDTNRLFEIVSVTGDLPLSAKSYSNFFAVFDTTRNPGTTQRSSTVVCRFYDTSGNSYTDDIVFTQTVGAWAAFEPKTTRVSSSAQTVCTELSVNNLGEPYNMQLSYSALTGFTELPAQNWNGNTLCMDIPENQTSSTRRISIRYSDADNPALDASFNLYQSGATVTKNIALDPLVINASSADTSGYTNIVTTGCSFSSYTITNRGGQQYTIGDPVVVGNQLRFTFPANTGSSRSETFSMQLFDTDGNSYNTFLVVSQEAKGTSGNVPDPWSDTGDTAYTWYKDDSLLRVLPPTKILAYDEETAYWPVTAHTFNDVGVRASGDVVFTYELLEDGSPEYNSHSLYAYTEDNTGTTQQVSTIKLVAFSGTSAYSASTVLMKNPDSHGWITASPNPVNAASLQNSVNVYLTLTNCQRNINKETTDNPKFDAATWVSVTRVNNTTLTFNFQANSSPQLRATYYYVYGLDTSGNNVYCRIDLIQEGNNMGISITPDRTSLGKAAGSFTARVESTESGNFSFSASPWMVITSYVPESQYGGTLYIDYYENNNEWPRTGDIIATQQISKAPYTLSAKTQISQTNTADTAFIRVTPSSISVDRTAGVVEAQVSYGGLATVPELVQNDGNMSIVSYDLDSNLITVVYGANDTSMDKYKNFTVTAMSTNGNVIEAAFSISQGGTGLPVAPIWRDYVLTLPTPGQGYINYNISYDGTIVYTGRAYGMGQDNIELYYNHICKPFLSNHIDFTEGYQSIRDWLGNFIITSPELGDITSVSFFEDYSYENREMQNVMSLNNPITNEVVEGSYVPFSFFITGASGNVTIRQNGQQLTGLTINDNEQHRYFIDAQTGKTYSCLGVNYRTIKTCEARYSLYYVNSYGGVDVLPFRGKSFKKTDNITRLNYSRSFRNNTLEFENVNYMNEIKPVWELNTHYMVDEQSRKIHELVESTCVYLYDALEQTYTPVVMTDKKLEYKTYFNQGRKFYTYTINVEESQSKERR